MKAKSSLRESGWGEELGGVRGAARAEGAVRNSRDPSVQPTSGKDRPYKPKAKAGGAQRESEGAVVPTMAVKKNAVGGKDPYSGCAVRSGKRWGMTEFSRSNHPHEQMLREKVRQRSEQLWDVAKQDQARTNTPKSKPRRLTPARWNRSRIMRCVISKSVMAPPRKGRTATM